MLDPKKPCRSHSTDNIQSYRDTQLNTRDTRLNAGGPGRERATLACYGRIEGEAHAAPYGEFVIWRYRNRKLPKATFLCLMSGLAAKHRLGLHG